MSDNNEAENYANIASECQAYAAVIMYSIGTLVVLWYVRAMVKTQGCKNYSLLALLVFTIMYCVTSVVGYLEWIVVKYFFYNLFTALIWGADNACHWIVA